MAPISHSCDSADEDYIDMEVSSNANFSYPINSPPHPREFEFQMSSGSLERDSTTSPADELFYKGKLLPLHLPPRLQMVEKILQSSSYDCKTDTIASEDNYGTPLANSTITTPTATSTPFESCNISPSDSCQVSRELHPEEYFQYSNEASSFIGQNSKKSWTRKLKLIKQSSIGLKLKASRSYIKSLFSKSGCSQEPNVGEGSAPKEYFEVTKKNQPGQTQARYQRSVTAVMGLDKERIREDDVSQHRRSFSVMMKRYSTTNSSSSSSSSGSSSYSNSGHLNGFCEPRLLKRSSSANSEIESSIQGAIAHCKQSQQLFHSRNTASEVAFCSLSVPRIVSL